MNRTWRFHPKDYEIGENERLYERMAAKGWLLKKRGLYLSRFERAEPEKRRYRIELSVPEGIDAEQELPEEQVDLYEECGWSFVTRQHLIHVFTAPEGSDAPEFYQDSAAQADTLKALRRQYRFSWVFYLILFGIEIWFILAVGGAAGGQRSGGTASRMVSSDGILFILSDVYQLEGDRGRVWRIPAVAAV